MGRYDYACPPRPASKRPNTPPPLVARLPLPFFQKLISACSCDESRSWCDAAAHGHHYRGGISYSASSSKAFHCRKGQLTSWHFDDMPCDTRGSRNMVPVGNSNHCRSQQRACHPQFWIDTGEVSAVAYTSLNVVISHILIIIMRIEWMCENKAMMKISSTIAFFTFTTPVVSFLESTGSWCQWNSCKNPRLSTDGHRQLQDTQ